MYLLDTNTLIYLFKQQGFVAAHLRQLQASQIAIPSVVLFELEYGVLRSTKPEVQQKGMDAAKAAYRVLPLDAKSAKSAAWVNHTLEVAGTPIGHGDQLIAGIALANDLTLITRNTREFSRVPGLRLENWFDTPPVAPVS
jgi:tRNA(fMet)-specific endonuclease VapC